MVSKTCYKDHTFSGTRMTDSADWECWQSTSASVPKIFFSFLIFICRISLFSSESLVCPGGTLYVGPFTQKLQILIAEKCHNLQKGCIVGKKLKKAGELRKLAFLFCSLITDFWPLAGRFVLQYDGRYFLQSKTASRINGPAEKSARSKHKLLLRIRVYS